MKLWKTWILQYRKTLKILIITTTKVQFTMHNNLAIVLDKMNRLQEALEFYDSAIQKNPEHSDYYNNKGIVIYNIQANTLTKLNRLDEALENYYLAIRINPENSLYYNNIALTLNIRNRLEEAKKNCDIATQIIPDNHSYSQCKSQTKYKQFISCYFIQTEQIGRNIYKFQLIL
ncbi:unnamed protein product [Paramecium octaurelia]|uniref:Tetratricopeptide repeat protein n=1 Tax=Paramecium octaurelia TaxID=43137 RepID=A0A8S1X3J5_PAROT|nr:unnamed protein product [Paramecium octaurelia]